MPTYLNPLAILDLPAADPSGLDAATLRKAKKRLYSEQYLDERESIRYLGKDFNRHDLETALERAEAPDWLTAYCAAAAYPGLSNYLLDPNRPPTDVESQVWADVRLEPILRTYLFPLYADALRRAYIRDWVNELQTLLAWPIARFGSREVAYDPTYQELRLGLRTYLRSVLRYVDNPAIVPRELMEVKVLRDHFPLRSVRHLPDYFHDMLRQVADVALQLIRASYVQQPALGKGHLEYVRNFPGLRPEQRQAFAELHAGLAHNLAIRSKVQTGIFATEAKDEVDFGKRGTLIGKILATVMILYIVLGLILGILG